MHGKNKDKQAHRKFTQPCMHLAYTCQSIINKHNAGIASFEHNKGILGNYIVFNYRSKLKFKLKININIPCTGGTVKPV